jgi:DNA repair ATPase RecN
MTNANKSWSKTDEKKLINRVNEILQRGDDIEIAYQEVSDEIGRTPRACKDRWNQLYKSRRRTALKAVQTHDYTELFTNFAKSYQELERIMGDLLSENERLKERVQQLETMEAKFREVSNYFKAI